MHNNKKILKAVIFDMDGLLFDTESLLVKFWHEAGMKYGYNITPEHVISIRSLARVKAIPVFQGYFGSGFDYEAVRNERIRLMNEYINEYEKHGHWKDTAVMIKGKAVERFTYLFLEMWNISEQKPEDYEKYRLKL